MGRGVLKLSVVRSCLQAQVMIQDCDSQVYLQVGSSSTRFSTHLDHSRVEVRTASGSTAKRTPGLLDGVSRYKWALSAVPALGYPLFHGLAKQEAHSCHLWDNLIPRPRLPSPSTLLMPDEVFTPQSPLSPDTITKPCLLDLEGD